MLSSFKRHPSRSPIIPRAALPDPAWLLTERVHPHCGTVVRAIPCRSLRPGDRPTPRQDPDSALPCCCHHRHTATPPHHHTATPPHRHTATPPHRRAAQENKKVSLAASASHSRFWRPRAQHAPRHSPSLSLPITHGASSSPPVTQVRARGGAPVAALPNVVISRASGWPPMLRAMPVSTRHTRPPPPALQPDPAWGVWPTTMRTHPTADRAAPRAAASASNSSTAAGSENRRFQTCGGSGQRWE